MIGWPTVRHSWIACTALLAACFTDSGALPTTGAASTDAATSTTTTGEPATTTTTTTTTGDVTTGGTTTGDATTGVDATTMSLTSGATTGGTTTGDATTDTTAAGTTGMIDIPIPGCDPLYFNDFSQNDGGLVYEGGDWVWNQDTGELVLTNNGGSVSAWIPDVKWTDMVLHTRVRFDNGSGYASLRARGQPNVGDYYYASPTVGDQRLVVGVNAGGQASNKANAPVQLAANTWYLLRFDVVGQDLSAQIEGVGAKFVDGKFLEGSAGLGGFGIGAFSFDWFLVGKP